MSDYIPEDCWAEILKRLPVKSLGQVRCVCRRWDALICSSSFIANHHSFSKAKPRFFIDIVYQRSSNRRICAIVDSDSHDEDAATFFPRIPTSQIPALKGPYRYILVGSARGIICFRSYYSSYTNDRCEIFLWNPLINKHIILPDARSRPISSHEPESVAIAVGVKPSEEGDLRVLRFFTHPSDGNLAPVRAAEIYSVGQGAWRSLQANIPRCQIDHFGPVMHNGHGDVHWVARDDAYSYQLIRFGFEEEEFSCIPLPDVLADSHHSFLYVALYFGRLALFQHDDEYSCSHWKIWTRGAAEDSWSVIACIDQSEMLSSILGIAHDDQVPMSSLDYPEDGDLVLHYLTSRSFRQLGMHPWTRADACPFVESLVFMDGEGGALTLPQSD